MRRKDVFQSSFLGQDDVPRPVVVTIAFVKLEEVTGDRGKEQKAVIHWTDGLKPMICNNINWTTIEEAYGDESDFWAGKQVEVYVDPNVMFGSKRVGGVRVRIPRPGATATPPASNGDLWYFPKAIEEGAKVGISRDDLIAAAKSRGFTAWTPSRDTPWVKVMIAEREHSQPFGEEIQPPPSQDNDIPF